MKGADWRVGPELRVLKRFCRIFVAFFGVSPSRRRGAVTPTLGVIPGVGSLHLVHT